MIAKQCYIQQSTLLNFLGTLLLLVISWTMLYLILHDEVLPKGDLFRLLVLVILAYIVGIGFTYLRLPALLGMLITGVVLKTVGFFHLSGIYPNLVLISRDIALAVILSRAGLGLDAQALRKFAFTVLKLSIVPCCAEAIAAAVFSHYILGFPWLWGFLLGFLLSAISPAVVVPTLLSLKERGYGEDKGIATLIIAASSVDDIISISLYSIFLSIIFSHSSSKSLIMEIMQGPLEMLLGLLVGIVWGLIAACFPHRKDKNVICKRTAMVGLGALCATLGCSEVGFPGAGPLACITSAFVAALSWNIQGWDVKVPTPVSNVFSGFWVVMQPILFSLIGTEINLYSLIPQNVLYGIAIVLLSLCVRIMVCFLTLLGDKLDFREMVFVNFAWLPKATVQAALAPKALDMLRSEENSSKEDLERSEMLLTTAVLAILIAAPIGAIAISVSGPFLLNKKSLPKNDLC